MTSMGIRLGFAALGLVTASFASFTPAALALAASSPVVKVRSTLGSGPTLTGSGVAFKAQGRTWVLTSEHVVFHAASGSPNLIQGVNGKEARVSLRAVDWGMGLALLEVEGALPTDGALASLDRFASAPPALGLKDRNSP